MSLFYPTANLMRTLNLSSPRSMKSLLILILVCAAGYVSYSQSQYYDGRNHSYCTSCRTTIQSMPADVLFGVRISETGDVYFSMSDKNWFEKVFKDNSYGVAVDIVSKDRYDCAANVSAGNSIPRGTLIPGKFRNELLANSNKLVEGSIFVKVGTIPPHLKGKELEGNLIILNGPYICYYTNLVDIPRSSWQLLPMGLFTDSLVNVFRNSDTTATGFFTYTGKLKIEIPFSKGSAAFDPGFLSKYLDSLNMKSSGIKKVEIRAYSSVEGSEAVNKKLMSKRAESVITALRKIDHSLQRVSIIAAENWLEFFKDIKGTDFEDLGSLTKFEIKQELTDADVLSEIEPILASHRKVIAVLWIENNSSFHNETDSSILGEFRKAVVSRDITKAQYLQKELARRISDNKLPLSYIGRIEIPASKEFAPILNDREVYRHLLKSTDEYEALENFLEIRKIDPLNGRLNYNICTLRFFMWQYGNDSVSRAVLFEEIERLPGQGIPSVLVERMKVNYYILKGEDQMQALNYAGKDSSLNEIKKRYQNISASDEDILSLAKYYSYYSRRNWALDIVAPEIAKLNVSEELLFYYLNLLFFHPEMYGSEEFKKATLNAININPQRFCDFFRSIDRGGASMQLLEYPEIKKVYCEECVSSRYKL